MSNETVGSGYAVLDLRVKQLEREMKDIKQDLKEHLKENNQEHEEMQKRIADGAVSMGEIKIMFSHIVQSSEEMKDDIKALGEASNKEKGWRAMIIDLVKIILMILGFIATGKWVL